MLHTSKEHMFQIEYIIVEMKKQVIEDKLKNDEINFDEVEKYLSVKPQ